MLTIFPLSSWPQWGTTKAAAFLPSHSQNHVWVWMSLAKKTTNFVMHYAARLCIYTWYISAFLDSIYFNILLSYCLHLCLFLNFVKLLSSHDASKGARAPKAWKSAVLNEIENKVGENGKTHRSSGYLEIPGDTLQKPMNKQNMIEHVESGLSLWSFQKST